MDSLAARQLCSRLVWGHAQRCSELTPSSVLGNQTWVGRTHCAIALAPLSILDGHRDQPYMTCGPSSAGQALSPHTRGSEGQGRVSAGSLSPESLAGMVLSARDRKGKTLGVRGPEWGDSTPREMNLTTQMSGVMAEMGEDVPGGQGATPPPPSAMATWQERSPEGALGLCARL